MTQPNFPGYRVNNYFRPNEPRNFISQEFHSMEEACQNFESDYYQPVADKNV